MPPLFLLLFPLALICQTRWCSVPQCSPATKIVPPSAAAAAEEESITDRRQKEKSFFATPCNTLCANFFGRCSYNFCYGENVCSLGMKTLNVHKCHTATHFQIAGHTVYGFNGTIDKTYQVRTERKLFRTFFTNFSNDLSHEEPPPPPFTLLHTRMDFLPFPNQLLQSNEGKKKALSSLPSSPYHGYIEWEEGGGEEKKRREREFPLLRHRRGKSGSLPPSYHFNQEEEEEGGGHKNMFVLRARERERRGRREDSLLPYSGGGRRRFLLSYDLAEERKGGGRAKSLQSNLLKEGGEDSPKKLNGMW